MQSEIDELRQLNAALLNVCKEIADIPDGNYVLGHDLSAKLRATIAVCSPDIIPPLPSEVQKQASFIDKIFGRGE